MPWRLLTVGKKKTLDFFLKAHTVILGWQVLNSNINMHVYIYIY